MRAHIAGAVVMLATGLLRGSPALGFIDPLSFVRDCDAQAIASEGGRHVTVTGTYVCPEVVRNAQFKIEVSVLQESTQAVFQGITSGQCRNSSGSFIIEGPVREGSAVFVTGSALACGLAVTSRRAPINSVTHWCAFVSIVEE
jgi:hypothetical protein